MTEKNHECEKMKIKVTETVTKIYELDPEIVIQRMRDKDYPETSESESEAEREHWSQWVLSPAGDKYYLYKILGGSMDISDWIDKAKLISTETVIEDIGEP